MDISWNATPWIAELLAGNWSDTIKDMMSAYDEEHRSDGVTMWYIFLGKYMGLSREAVIVTACG